jgi:phospholipid/cholesterol/gamma-HCH transport system substrate-binding protein
MKSISRMNPYRVGLGALAGIVLLGGVILAASVISWGQSSYKVVLEHTAGLRVGEDVQVAGVSSGEVKSIELDGDQVVVGFTLDSDIELGSETTAAVRVATLLGTHYLRIEPKGGGSLDDDTIPMAQTSVPYNLQDVLEEGGLALQELDPKLLAQALTAATDALDAGSDDLGPALEGITRIGTVVETRMEQAGQLLEAARSVTDQLAGSTDDIIGLMRQSQLVLDEIVRRRAELHELLVDAEALATALTDITRSADRTIGPTLRDLNATIDTLRQNEELLEEGFRVLAPSARYVANAFGSGRWADIYAPGIAPDAVTCKYEGGC